MYFSLLCRIAYCVPLLFLAVLFPEVTLGQSRLNILFIMSDDHAYQAISAYDSQLNKTPHIDRLANEGIRFDRCYVTDSICGPSRACLLTGKYSHTNGVRDNFTAFDGSQVTMPKLLQAAGYQTAIIGKWHLKSDPTGFDHWDILPGQGKYYRPDFRTAQGKRAVPGYVTDITTDLALDWLERKRDVSRPFLLMVHHKAPHRPWDPAPEHLKAYEDTHFPEPASFADDYTGRTSASINAEMRIEQMRPAGDLKIWGPDNKHRVWLYNHMTAKDRKQWDEHFDPRFTERVDDSSTDLERRRWMRQLYLQDYLGCVNSVDESVGKMLDWLDTSGLAETTLVVYTSDQGFYLGEHGWFDKRFMYEESLRTPLLIRPPRAQVNKKDAAEQEHIEKRIVSNADFAPTFLDLAGLVPPAEMQGRSFAPLLGPITFSNDWIERDVFYYHYYEGPDRDHAVARHDGVTDGQYKLIDFYENGERELFDLEADPNEMQSQYGNTVYANVQQRLEQRLAQERRRLKVPEFTGK